MRRSSASIRRTSRKVATGTENVELVRCLLTSLGSASELEHYQLPAYDLDLLDDPEHERLTGEVTEVKRMLTSFVRSLRVLANQQNPKADA